MPTPHWSKQKRPVMSQQERFSLWPCHKLIRRDRLAIFAGVQTFCRSFFCPKSIYWRPRFSAPRIYSIFNCSIHFNAHPSAICDPSCLTSVILRELVYNSRSPRSYLASSIAYVHTKETGVVIFCRLKIVAKSLNAIRLSHYANTTILMF